MARYIDADKLIDNLEELQFNAPVMTPVMKIYNVIELVEDQPTADVAEVKHGYNATYMNPVDEFVCSVCSFKCTDYTEIVTEENDDIWYRECEFDHCPRCSAKMDGGKEE